MDTKTAQNTSPGTVVVQYAFRGNTRKQRELLIPDYENNFTCAMFKDAVFSSNEIHFATLLPIQLCVCVKTELDELRELSDSEIVSSKDSFIVSISGTSDSLNYILPCIADYKNAESLQSVKPLIDLPKKYDTSDGTVISELLNASFDLFKAGQVNPLLGLLYAISLMSSDSISLNSITSNQTCIKILAKIFVFLSSLIGNDNNVACMSDIYSLMSDFCLEAIMNIILPKDPFGLFPGESIFAVRGQIDSTSNLLLQAIASEGVFDAMVYLFSLQIESVLFIKLCQKLIVSIGSLSYKNIKMLDTFTKSGTLFDALDKKISLSYEPDDIKKELFQLKLLSINFIGYEMKFSNEFEKKVPSENAKKWLADVTIWTVMSFDVSSSAVVMSGEALPADSGIYIQDYTNEKSPEINQLFQYFKNEVMDSTSKCIDYIFFALLDGVKSSIVQNPVFGEMVQNYPEVLCLIVDVIKAYIEANPTHNLTMLHKVYNIWGILFSDMFLLPYCKKRIHFFLRQKIIDLVSSSVDDPAWKKSRDILLIRLYTIFSSKVDHEHHVIYTEIIAAILSKYVPNTASDIVMLLNILSFTPPEKTSILSPSFVLARSSIMHSLILSFEQESFLKELVFKIDTFDQLFKLIKIKEIEAFAANEITKLLVAAGKYNGEILDEMVQKSLNFISGFTGKESDDDFSPLLSILHSIEESSQLGTKISKTFVNKGMFQILLTLMTFQIPLYPSRKIALTNECLLIIYYSDIDDFENLVGYDQLKAILASFADVFFKEGTEIVDRLFELSLRTRSEVSWGKKVFTQNPHFILLIFELLPVMGMTNVVYTLSKFYTIFQSLPNVAACNDAGLTRILLSIIEGTCIQSSSLIFSDTAVLAKLVEVIQLLATYSLDAADLKRIIRLLSRTSPDGTSRLSTFPYLVKCLRKTSFGEVGPTSYYNFDGRTSQFLLPQFDHWPFGQGGTIYMWLRIESLSRKKIVHNAEKTDVSKIEPPSPAGAYQFDPSYKPRIICFMSENRLDGMELFIDDGTLQLAITVCGKTEVFRCTPDKYLLPEKRWIALGFSFAPSVIVPNSGEFRVYVNGELLNRAPFTYPRNLVAVKYNSIGCLSAPNCDTQSFNGQIGTITFFDSVIDGPRIATMFKSGPKFLGTSKIESKDNLENSLVMCYTCKLQDGDTQINNYSVLRHETANLSAKTVNVAPCITIDFKSAVCCIDGGFFSLFPLMQMLEKPLIAPDPNATSDDKTLINILEIVHKLILGNEPNEIDEDLCEEMVNKNGYSALSHILRRLPNEYLTPKLVKFFGNMHKRMDSLPPPRALQFSLFNELLVNFHVWIRAPYETQKELFSLLYTIYFEKKHVIELQKILDVIRTFYWLGLNKKGDEIKVDKKDDNGDSNGINEMDDDDDDGKEEMVVGSDEKGEQENGKSIDNDVNKKEEEIINNIDEEKEDEDYKNVQLCQNVPIRADPNSSDKISELRKILFDIAKLKIDHSTNQNDVEAITKYAFWAGCTSREKNVSLENEYGDVLGILNVIDDPLEQDHLFFPNVFVEFDGVEALLRLFTLRSEIVRARTIGVLARLCHIKFFDDAGRKRVCAIAHTLLESLETAPVTFTIYNALLKMAIADFTNVTVEITHMTNLVFPEVLCLCLFPLLYKAPQDVRLRAYDDLDTILEKRSNAQSLLEKVRNWQIHLCKLLDGERTNFIAWMRSRKEDSSATESEETARIIELFGRIFTHSAFESIMLCYDWNEVDVLLSLLRAYDTVPINRPSSPLPPNNYFYLCRLSFFKAFTGRIARIVNGEAQIEYRDVANSSAPQFPSLISFCVHIFDSLLLVSPSVARPYIYPDQQLLKKQVELPKPQKLHPRFSSKRVSQLFSPQPQAEKPMQPAPRFDESNEGDSVDANSGPSDPDFELFILSNILAYADYLKLLTARNWDGAEKAKIANSLLQAHQGGFITLCTVAAARILQLHALVGWKDDGRRCKAAIGLLQIIAEALAPLGDDGEANPGFYWIFETTIRSFCVANVCENMYVAEEIFKLIFILVRYIAQFKKLEKFISREGANAVSSLAITTETSPIIYAYRKFNSEEWIPAAKEIHIRAQPWVQGILDDSMRALASAKKSDSKALEIVFSSRVQVSIIDSFAACAKVYSSEVSRLSKYVKDAIENQQINSNDWLKIKRSLQRGRGPWHEYEKDGDTNETVKRKLTKNECMGRQRFIVTKKRENCIRTTASQIRCCTTPVVLPPAAIIDKDVSHSEPFRYEHVDHTLVASMVSDADNGDKVFVKVRCKYIRPGKILEGICIVSKNGVTFKEMGAKYASDDGTAEMGAKIRTWSRDAIVQVYSRRYELNRTALEIFFNDDTNCYLNFETVRVRTYVLAKIVSGLKPPGLTWHVGCSSSPVDALKRSGVTDRWKRHEISNFDYIMALNTLSGRSFNDVTQYPVFPWVISDYISENLDFNNGGTFRNLSRPICSLKYTNSLYSSAASVRYFLGRLEPFASCIIPSNSGDAFVSVNEAWNKCLWELTPEFFSLPDFLCGGKEGDVVLPPWAHGSAEEFIRINRAALESEYVTLHLNEWIDLVFGCKQRGKEAASSNNIFNVVAYEGAIDCTKLRSETRLQVNAFGQVPDQLFTTPHPKVDKKPSKATEQYLFQDKNVHSWAAKVYSGPVVCVRQGAEAGTVIAASGPCEVCTYKVDRRRPSIPPTLRLVTSAQALAVKTPHFAQNITSSSSLFTISDGKLFSCGFWDGSFRVLSVGSAVPDVIIPAHRDVVTCITAVQGILAAGFRDTTLMLWDIPLQSTGVAAIVGSSIINSRKPLGPPRSVLYGHDEQITAIDISKELDIVISGALDGRVAAHALRTGKYLWSQTPLLRRSISFIRIIPQARIIAVYSQEKFSIALCNLSGKLLVEAKTQETFNDMIATADGRSLILGGKGIVSVFSIDDACRGSVSLRHTYNIGNNVNVRSLALSSEQDVLFAGLDDGNVIAISNDKVISN